LAIRSILLGEQALSDQTDWACLSLFKVGGEAWYGYYLQTNLEVYQVYEQNAFL
jgi:hypothetical protein